ncbi:MAG: hypothetical protein GXO35_08020 [Gammaproteobacteria bacterium]|nr:hypothetical protein [Gammaproteobacteria bacterium]
MKKLSLSTFLLTAGMTLSAHAFSADPHPGQALETAANCLKCHASQPYDPSKTKDWPALVKVVQFCNDNLNSGMFEDEVEELADYLNEKHYHYAK